MCIDETSCYGTGGFFLDKICVEKTFKFAILHGGGHNTLVTDDTEEVRNHFMVVKVVMKNCYYLYMEYHCVNYYYVYQL